MQTRTSTLKFIRLAIIVIVACIIVGYAIWRSRDFVKGPDLEIFEPTNGISIESNTILISGKAIRANNLLLNGNSISIDEEGSWKETLIIFPGINHISIEASDRFGKKVNKVITVWGKAGFPTSKTITPVIPASLDSDSTNTSSNSTVSTSTSTSNPSSAPQNN